MNKLKGTIGKTPKLSGEIKAQIVTVGTGEDGATFIPAVSENGIISWTNDKGLENPQPVNIKGPQGETGSKGDTGDAGKDGYTPIKGTDYFTEADKAEIVAETVENIPTATTDIKGLIKVGDGLTMTGDVLSVKGDNEYELIETITVSDAGITAISRNTETSGKSYKFSKLRLAVHIPINTGASSVTYDAGFTRISMNHINTYDTWSNVFFWVENGRIMADCSYGTTGEWAATQVYNLGGYWLNRALNNPANFIESISITAGGNATFPIGSTFEIWGVRA